MRKIFGMIGSTVAGSVGWSMGAYVGIGTAVLLSAVGTGVGLYYGFKLFDQWLG